jgi:hypothetical protein
MLLMMTGVLSAQAFRLKFTAKTPFSVGSGSLPAGTYEIRVSEDTDENTFECTAASGSPSVLFEADAMETIPTTTGLDFQKYGDKLVLKSFSIAGQQGFFIPISMHEKKAKKTGGKPTKVSTPATKS